MDAPEGRRRLQEEVERLEERRAQLERQIEGMRTVQDGWGAIIRLNVGGKLFDTSRSTLTRFEDSMLGAMFSGRHEPKKDQDGRVFIDRKGKLFEHVLDFLRDPQTWSPPPKLEAQLRTEFDFFGLPFPEVDVQPQQSENKPGQSAPSVAS